MAAGPPVLSAIDQALQLLDLIETESTRFLASVEKGTHQIAVVYSEAEATRDLNALNAHFANFEALINEYELQGLQLSPITDLKQLQDSARLKMDQAVDELKRLRKNADRALTSFKQPVAQ